MRFHFWNTLTIAFVGGHFLLLAAVLAVVSATWFTSYEPTANRLNALIPRLRDTAKQVDETNNDIRNMVARSGSVQLGTREAVSVSTHYSAQIRALSEQTFRYNQLVIDYRGSIRLLQERYPPITIWVWQRVYGHPLFLQLKGVPGWPASLETNTPSKFACKTAPSRGGLSLGPVAVVFLAVILLG